jgi:hypothetical protein
MDTPGKKKNVETVICITTDKISEKHFAYEEGRLKGIPCRKG